MLRNLLVTGGAGFIGTNFVYHTVRERACRRIIVLDSLTYAGNLRSLDPLVSTGAIRFVRGDINDADLVLSLIAEEEIDLIVHFAAESHVDRSISGPDAFLQTNIMGTHTLLRMARKHGLAGRGADPRSVRFHHVSTDEVYGTLGPDDDPFVETSPYAPNSPYAATKAAADHLVRAYHHTYGLPVTTSNCSNNYGPFQFPEKLISLAIVNALDGTQIPVYGDGLQTRDWLYVEDHCRAVWQTIERGTVGETYNIGGGCSSMSNLDLLGLICDAVDHAVMTVAAARERFQNAPAARGAAAKELIQHVKDRPGHDRRYAVDFSKAARDLGYAPRESLRSGIARTVRWYIENEEWWRHVMDGSYRSWMKDQYGPGSKPNPERSVTTA